MSYRTIKGLERRGHRTVYMAVEARLVSPVLLLLKVSDTSCLLEPTVLRPEISFSPFITDLLETVARKMRTPWD